MRLSITIGMKSSAEASPMMSLGCRPRLLSLFSVDDFKEFLNHFSGLSLGLVIEYITGKSEKIALRIYQCP